MIFLKFSTFLCVILIAIVFISITSSNEISYEYDPFEDETKSPIEAWHEFLVKVIGDRDGDKLTVFESIDKVRQDL